MSTDSTDYEGRLRELAGGAEFSLPAAQQLLAALQGLSDSLTQFSSDPGFQGKAGTAAVQEVAQLKDDIAILQKSVGSEGDTNSVLDIVAKANEQKTAAAKALTELEANHPGSLSPAQTLAIGAATAGATIVLDPVVSIVAGVGAIFAANTALAAARQSAARKSVVDIGERLNELSGQLGGSGFYVPGGSGSNDTNSGGGGGSTSSGGSGGGTGSSGYANDFNIGPDPLHSVAQLPGVKVDPSAIGGGSTPGATSPGGGSSRLPVGGLPDPSLIVPGGGGGLVPDGPVGDGRSQLPGVGIGGGVSGGGGAGHGGGLGGGLAAGVGGGLMLGGGSRLAGGGLGGAGLGGAGLGGGLAGGGSGSLPGAAGSGRGLLGGVNRSSAGASGAAEAESTAAGGARGAASPMMGGMGGARGAGGEKKRGRGLGGPIAPKLEDDPDPLQRSDASGAGSRE